MRVGSYWLTAGSRGAAARAGLARSGLTLVGLALSAALSAPAAAAPIPAAARIADPGGLLAAPATIRAGASEAALRDDGAPPDAVGGDGVWSADLALEPGATVEVTVAGGGRRWGASVEAPGAAEGSLDLTIAGEDLLPGAQATPDRAAPARAAARDDGVPFRWALAGWGLAALLAGLALALSSRRILPPAPPSLPGAGPALSGRYRVPPEEALAALTWLVQRHRVIVVGRPPQVEAPPGSIFPAARAADVPGMIEALEGRGRPIVVWLADPAIRAPEGATVVVVRGTDGRTLPA